jgi:hypothetical protein
MRGWSSSPLIVLGLVMGPVARAADGGAAAGEPVLVGPSGAARNVRSVTLDLEPFTGESRTRTLRYDVDAASAPLSVGDYPGQPSWVVAARLVLAEVGPGRLLHSENGVVEAVGVLQTLRNRLEPSVWNPEGVPGVRPWPGCGPSGTFHTCADVDQYRGLTQALALRPASVVRDPGDRARALDVAVAAWWLVFRADVPDVTGGATGFVHRCGGTAYGAPRSACDGVPAADGTPDVRGAAASTGPVWFRGPGAFLPREGRYATRTLRVFDYVHGDAVVLLGLEGADAAADDGDARAPTE